MGPCPDDSGCSGLVASMALVRSWKSLKPGTRSNVSLVPIDQFASSDLAGLPAKVHACSRVKGLNPPLVAIDLHICQKRSGQSNVWTIRSKSQLLEASY